MVVDLWLTGKAAVPAAPSCAAVTPCHSAGHGLGCVALPPLPPGSAQAADVHLMAVVLLLMLGYDIIPGLAPQKSALHRQGCDSHAPSCTLCPYRRNARLCFALTCREVLKHMTPTQT